MNIYKCLLPIERAAALYCLLTCLLMLAMAPRLVDPTAMLVMRAEWLLMTVALVLLSRIPLLTSTKGERLPLVSFLRTSAQLAWLILWYPDTYEFNRSFQNLDHVFAKADHVLFGCQPSLEFSSALPGAFWSEAFNLGYWSYYPMIAVLIFAVFFLRSPFPTIPEHGSPTRSLFQKGEGSPYPFLKDTVSTLILISFFLFYVIYIFVPVAGPQFYFEAVGIDTVVSGNFPSLGTYFSSHTHAMAAPGYTDGFFYQLVAGAQETGERPTAAFPSSHIGVSTIVLLLTRRHCPKLLWLFMPLWVLLCCATVYIRAHYLVDAIAGLLIAPLILWLAQRLSRPLSASGK